MAGERIPFRALVVLAIAGIVAGCADKASGPPAPATPIEHVIVVVGENQSFDALFGTYDPPAGEQVWNLRSRGIVDANGLPGPSFAKAAQQQAEVLTRFEISPAKTGTYATLPQPNTTFGGLQQGVCAGSPSLCPDPGLSEEDQGLLFLGGTGQSQARADCRYPTDLPNGPYQITGPYPPLTRASSCPDLLPVDPIDTAGDPVHSFFQMWQQSDCSMAYASADNPSGCLADLTTWVAVSVGWAVGRPPANELDTAQGGTPMGFYNIAAGDLPFFRELAATYSMSDNYHQFLMGGTMANSYALGTADVLVYSDANGDPATPPESTILDPDPVPGSNNFYQRAAFGRNSDPGSTSQSAYVDCSDDTQPGVAAITEYLDSLPYAPFRGGNCDPGRYYVVTNNYPSYRLDGSLVTSESNEFPAGPDYTVGPSKVRTIADALNEARFSWAFYGEGSARADATPPQNFLYCEICNPFQYTTSIMTTSEREKIFDIDAFYAHVQDGSLPAVSYVKPDTNLDGHPGTSTPPLYEAFLRKLIGAVQANQELWSKTAILITFDEGGGLYDSGYIQPIDFFGDGPRTVMIAVSPFSKGGRIDHTYADHASVLKFIEHNWKLQPLTDRSRDNLPNPVANADTPYFPTNSPAIGDLTTLFRF